MAINFIDGKYVDPNGRVHLDPTVYKDWQIAEEAEKTLPPVEYFREKLGLLPEEIIPYGKTPKIDFIKVMNRLTASSSKSPPSPPPPSARVSPPFLWA